MSLVRFLQPDDVPVYIAPHLVVGIWEASLEALSKDGVAKHVVIAWCMPSEMPDRTHIGRRNIVIGTPDGVATALGWKASS